MVESRVTSIGDEPNRPTRVHDDVRGPRIGVDELYDAFRRAVAVAKHEPWAFAEADGYRLLWCRADEQPRFRDLPDLPAAFAVVGRHAQCDTHLDGDREVALRHLLVRPGRLDDGALALRFIDLRAEMPFYVLDEVPHRSIAATGPVAIRLGRYALIALPFVGGKLAATELTTPVIEHDVRPPPRSAAPRSTTSITVLPRVTGVMEVAARQLPGDASISVMRDEVSASVGVTREDLDRGVLIGRLPRCLDGGVRSILSAQISRAHLLVLAEDERVTAFDLASTNGTYKRGRPVGCATMRDEGSTLILSKHRGVTIRFRREPLTS